MKEGSELPTDNIEALQHQIALMIQNSNLQMDTIEKLTDRLREAEIIILGLRSKLNTVQSELLTAKSDRDLSRQTNNNLRKMIEYDVEEATLNRNKELERTAEVLKLENEAMKDFIETVYKGTIQLFNINHGQIN